MYVWGYFFKKKITANHNTVVVGLEEEELVEVVVFEVATAAIFGTDDDIDIFSTFFSLEEDWIRSKAANTSCFIRTNNLPLFQGFCKFKGLKSSLKQRSRDPMTATKQKFFNLSFS